MQVLYIFVALMQSSFNDFFNRDDSPKRKLDLQVLLCEGVGCRVWAVGGRKKSIEQMPSPLHPTPYPLFLTLYPYRSISPRQAVSGAIIQQFSLKNKLLSYQKKQPESFFTSPYRICHT